MSRCADGKSRQNKREGKPVTSLMTGMTVTCRPLTEWPGQIFGALSMSQAGRACSESPCMNLASCKLLTSVTSKSGMDA